ncbi:MAG TPA: site-specific DNA-methyltransferase [Vicinamibacterales bacterium]|nr:site-specific DNA-methyltransferase [Vicinamibacterales bacterium]
MLARIDRERGKRDGRSELHNTLLRSDLDGMTAHRWQLLATIPEAEIRQREADCNDAQRELTSTALYLERSRQQREEDRQAAWIAAADVARQATADDTLGVFHLDCQALAASHLEPDSVDLVFTDPPYHDTTLDLYVDLGTIAARVLKDGGSLITYIAHHRLPEIVAMLQAAGLTFFWPLAITYDSPSPKARMREYGIVVEWKPLLWFVKGRFRCRDDMRWVADRVVSPDREKRFHPWQQGIAPATYYIEALTRPGELVVDPFCGGGTTAVAAAHTRRRWITGDVDERAVWIARERIRQACSDASSPDTTDRPDTTELAE